MFSKTFFKAILFYSFYNFNLHSDKPPKIIILTNGKSMINFTLFMKTIVSKWKTWNSNEKNYKFIIPFYGLLRAHQDTRISPGVCENWRVFVRLEIDKPDMQKWDWKHLNPLPRYSREFNTMEFQNRNSHTRWSEQ